MHIASLTWLRSCVIDDGIRATPETATRAHGPNFCDRPIPSRASVGRVRKHFRGRAKLLTTLLASVASLRPPTFLSPFDTRGRINACFTNYVVIVRP